MSQTSIIFGALIIGFLGYITAKGRLPLYIGTLWGSAAPSSGATPAGNVSFGPIQTTTVTSPSGSTCTPAGSFWQSFGIGRC